MFVICACPVRLRSMDLFRQTRRGVCQMLHILVFEHLGVRILSAVLCFQDGGCYLEAFCVENKRRVKVREVTVVCWEKKITIFHSARIPGAR